MSCARGCCATQAEHYKSIVASVPSEQVRKQRDYDRNLANDRHAYKRMRDEGLQPSSVKGAAFIEQNATSRHEVETGRILPEPLAKRIDAAVETARQVCATPTSAASV